ncbi:MAG: glucokinase [Deltaproteobacteria bacterium]|nr:glucokinase [Deltaproteobacteria bacterium]
MIVLAGEISAGTCRLALVRDQQPFFERSYTSSDFGSADAVVERFLHEARKSLGAETLPRRACLGVPGPVQDATCKVTNLPWFVEARTIERRTKIESVTLINDFQAIALGATVLGDEHLVPIGGGPRKPEGPMAVAGAGTGLGEAFLVWSTAEARYQVIPSEGGHVEFTPRTGLEAGLGSYLSGRYGRVSYERVLSMRGLADIFGFLSSEPALAPLVREETRAQLVMEDPALVITRQAADSRDPICAMAVNQLCSTLGAFAGNMALTFLATGGVYIAGSLTPRLLPFLQNGVFRQSFEAKGRFQPLISQIPCFAITHPQVGLLGAASMAARA